MISPKTEKFVSDLLSLLLMIVDQKTTDVVALRILLERRGLSRKQLQQELDEVRETAAVKRRSRAAFSPIKQEVLDILRSVGMKETLERLPVRGRVQ